MRNFKAHTGATQPWGGTVTSTYPAQPHSTLTVSPLGVSLGAVIYTGDDTSQWMGRSGKASFHSSKRPPGMRKTGRR